MQQSCPPPSLNVYFSLFFFVLHPERISVTNQTTRQEKIDESGYY